MERGELQCARMHAQRTQQQQQDDGEEEDDDGEDDSEERLACASLAPQPATTTATATLPILLEYCRDVLFVVVV